MNIQNQEVELLVSIVDLENKLCRRCMENVTILCSKKKQMQETKFVDVCTVTDEPTMYVSQHIEEVNQLKTKIMYLEDSIKHYEQLFTNEKPAALPYIEPQQQYT